MRQATRIVRDDPRSDNAHAGDLAGNAKGITRTTRSLFDTQKVVSRCRDRVCGTNSNLRERSTAPTARSADLRALTAALVAWAIAPPDWLQAAYAPSDVAS